MMSFTDDYLLVGNIFLIALPILLFAEREKKGSAITVMLADH